VPRGVLGWSAGKVAQRYLAVPAAVPPWPFAFLSASDLQSGIASRKSPADWRSAVHSLKKGVSPKGLSEESRWRLLAEQQAQPRPAQSRDFY
jgi:hypothetical protein